MPNGAKVFLSSVTAGTSRGLSETKLRKFVMCHSKFGELVSTPSGLSLSTSLPFKGSITRLLPLLS